MIKVIFRRLLFIIILSVQISSCVVTRSIQIETLQPARFTIEGSRRNIAVSASQTLLTESVALSESALNVPTDSLIANILFSFQFFLGNMTGYENANISVSTTNNEFDDYSDFDLLIFLDMLQINNNFYGQQQSFFEFEAFLYVNYSASWSIRNNTGSLLDEYTDRDLLIWRSGIYTDRTEAVESLPEVKDAWWDVGIAIAQRYAARIAPQWQTGSRSIYMINRFPDLSRMAYTAMQNDAYTRAFDIWENMLLSCRKRGQKNIKSQITYNMAVALEFQNELETAIYWAQRSANLNSRYRTNNYLRWLRERVGHREILDVQLNSGGNL